MKHEGYMKPALRQPPTWRSLTPPQIIASVVGLVYAEDEESAIVTAIEEHDVRPPIKSGSLPGRAESRPLYWQKF
jgi:hypothetical protein